MLFEKNENRGRRLQGMINGNKFRKYLNSKQGPIVFYFLTLPCLGFSCRMQKCYLIGRSDKSNQGKLAYFIRGNISVRRLTSCFTRLDSAVLLVLNLFGQIQSSQTGGQPYGDTSPYKVKVKNCIYKLACSSYRCLKKYRF